ncbi:MAG: WD40 repeat domain-containing protein, partial [Anaerolinea sp.]|nr:WD40 repeat domain-containing protein [Anaerolinea sp.]
TGMTRRLHLLALFLIGLFINLSPAAAQTDSGTPPMAFEARWSPDGLSLAVGSTDGLWLFDTTTFMPVQFLDDQTIYTAAFDPAQLRLAVGLSDVSQIAVIDRVLGETVFSTLTPFGPTDTFDVMYDLVYSPDGRLLAAANTDFIYLIDTETSAVIETLYTPDDRIDDYPAWITSLRFTPDATALYAADLTGRLLIYRLGERITTETYRLLGDGDRIEHLEILPDGSVLLRSLAILGIYRPGDPDLDATIESRDPEAGLPFPTIADGVRVLISDMDAPDQQVYGFALSPDSRLIALGQRTSWMLYDLQQQRALATYPVKFGPVIFEERVYSLAFSPDGARLAILSTDGQLQIVAVETGEVLAQPFTFSYGVNQRWG